jgi:hypothetical protein
MQDIEEELNPRWQWKKQRSAERRFFSLAN